MPFLLSSRAIQYHLQQFKSITIKEFDNKLAYNCIINPYSNKYNDPMGYIPCDDNGIGSGSDSLVSTGALAHIPGIIPGFVFPCGAVSHNSWSFFGSQ
jgi:hypothetical protein